MHSLKVVAASFFILHVWTVSDVCAGPLPPSPVKQKVVLHNVYTDDAGAPTINADGAAVLNDAARLLRDASPGVLVIIDGSPSSDPTLAQRRADVARAYLAQQGVDPTTISVRATEIANPVEPRAVAGRGAELERTHLAATDGN